MICKLLKKVWFKTKYGVKTIKEREEKKREDLIRNCTIKVFFHLYEIINDSIWTWKVEKYKER